MAQDRQEPRVTVGVGVVTIEFPNSEPYVIRDKETYEKFAMNVGNAYYEAWR